MPPGAKQVVQSRLLWPAANSPCFCGISCSGPVCCERSVQLTSEILELKAADRIPGWGMRRSPRRTIIMLCMLATEVIVFGQKAPSAANHPWDASSAKQQLPPPQLQPPVAIDPSKAYTLAELVNIAEQNNP